MKGKKICTRTRIAGDASMDEDDYWEVYSTMPVVYAHFFLQSSLSVYHAE